MPARKHTIPGIEKAGFRSHRLEAYGTPQRLLMNSRRFISGLRSGLRASHQQHGKETAGENVERKAEAGPPDRDTWTVNEHAMKEVENSVSSQGSHNQPEVLFKTRHGQHEKSG